MKNEREEEHLCWSVFIFSVLKKNIPEKSRNFGKTLLFLASKLSKFILSSFSNYLRLLLPLFELLWCDEERCDDDDFECDEEDLECDEEDLECDEDDLWRESSDLCPRLEAWNVTNTKNVTNLDDLRKKKYSKGLLIRIARNFKTGSRDRKSSP